MMNFWDTVLGNRLAEVLIRTLPELTEKMTKKEQYGAVVSNDEVVGYIWERLQKGEHYVTYMQKDDGHMFVIMEREKEC